MTCMRYVQICNGDLKEMRRKHQTKCIYALSCSSGSDILIIILCNIKNVFSGLF